MKKKSLKSIRLLWIEINYMKVEIMNLNLNDLDNEDEEQHDRSLSKEAERAVEQIRFGVKAAAVSQQLESSNMIAHINLETLESEVLCIELTVSGYLIVGNSFDTLDADVKEESLKKLKSFESIDALMLHVSPLYMKRFNKLVSERLVNLLQV